LSVDAGNPHFPPGAADDRIMELRGEITRRRLGQQRIGNRLYLDGVRATWSVQRAGRFGRVKQLDREAVVDNLSVTGAGILLLADPADQIGDVVDLCISGAWGKILVRRYQPTGDDAVSFWGVEFIRPDGPFNAAISAIIGSQSLVGADDEMRG
jgi:hypothetical protein